ncbi:hypothetical protein K469DRAFT_813214 [Zopfia rhizophila CBS 207.26]|uniref:Uncharacterized protein n=1 Tax=Zopfia rhizophila CBS 207.26 TaxID=1314779 RepID=A0A6A6DAM3_9PEZI|nr:hypothetical protein K469DRAFT_813214 [Zopfia rhizophila CBS 207.26]
MYDYKAKLYARGSRPRQIEFSDDMNGNPTPPERTSEDDIFPPQNLDFASQPTFAYACQLAFTTLCLVLQRIGDKNVLPHVHVMLVFLLSLTAIPYDCRSILDNVPWEHLALFLTKLAKSEKLNSLVENTSFPHRSRSARPLPEDYVVQGQVWSQWYYPEYWFDASDDEEDRSRELASAVKLKTERILWLGIRLASALHGGRIQYNNKSQRWSAAPAPSSESGLGTARVIASMTLTRLNRTHKGAKIWLERMAKIIAPPGNRARVRCSFWQGGSR